MNETNSKTDTKKPLRDPLSPLPKGSVGDNANNEDNAVRRRRGSRRYEDNANNKKSVNIQHSPSDLQLLQRALFASACVNASLIYRSFHLRRPYATLWHYTNDDQRMTLFNFIVKSLLE